MPALDPLRIRSFQCLAALSALIVAGCNRPPAASSDLSRLSPNSSPPPGAVGPANLFQSGDVPGAGERLAGPADSTDATSTSWQPPPPGSTLSPENAHRLLTGEVVFNPGAIQSSGIPVEEDTALAIGQDVQVKWSNTWWAGTIVGFEPDGRVRIHYFAWADSYDEPKHPSELQLDPSARLRALDRAYKRDGLQAPPLQFSPSEPAHSISAAQALATEQYSATIENPSRAAGGRDAHAASPEALSSGTWQPPPRGSAISLEDADRLLTGNVIFNPDAIESTGIPVLQNTPLAIGQSLQVQWGSSWWAATIVGFEPDGRVRIRYFGWADSFDESKSRSELQLDPDAPLRAIDRAFARKGW